jgi:hypothetical protein
MSKINKAPLSLSRLITYTKGKVRLEFLLVKFGSRSCGFIWWLFLWCFFLKLFVSSTGGQDCRGRGDSN